MRNLTVILCLQVLFTTTLMSQEILPPNDPLYEIVFEENFNGNILDTSKWLTHYPWGHFINSNVWPTYWANTTIPQCPSITTQRDLSSIAWNFKDTNNRKIKDGYCKLIARKENNVSPVWTYPADCNSPACQGYKCLDSINHTNCFKPVLLPFKYSNAMLYSRYKFRYGYFEIRFKIPDIPYYNNISLDKYRSYGPNFWLLNAANATSSLDSNEITYNEIDIYEITSNWINRYEKYYSSLHVKQENSIKFSFSTPNQTIVQPEVFYTAAVLWEPNRLQFFLNGLKTGELAMEKVTWLRLPMSLIIDNFMPAIHACIPIDSIYTQLPYEYSIDYVKVWQPKQACDTNKLVCNTNSQQYNSKLYKNITVGGSNCNTVFNNDTIHIAATESVLLDEGTEISGNASVTIETKECLPIIVIKPFKDKYFETPKPLTDDFYKTYFQNKNY